MNVEKNRQKETDSFNIIKDKINQIQNYLDFITENTPESFENYEKDLRSKAICEHYLEKIAEACIDLTFLVIKLKKLGVPESDECSFEILFKNSIISENLKGQLIDLKGMRNVISHEYGEVDDEKVYYSLTEELNRDVNEFLQAIKLYLEIK